MPNATSRGSPAPPDREEAAAATGGGPGYDANVFRPPLRPHRRLLAGTAAVLAFWLGFLVYLYVTAIHPQAGQVRKAGPQPLTDIPGPSALPGPVPIRPATVPSAPFGPAVPLGPIGPFGPALPTTGPAGPVPR
jgi:hypothetical protein